MSFSGERRATVLGNHNVVSTIHPVPRSPFDHSIRSDSSKHQVRDSLRREYRLQLAGIEGTYPRFHDHDIRAVRRQILMNLGAPRAVLQDLVGLHRREYRRVLWRIEIIGTVGMPYVDNRNFRGA